MASYISSKVGQKSNNVQQCPLLYLNTSLFFHLRVFQEQILQSLLVLIAIVCKYNCTTASLLVYAANCGSIQLAIL